MVLFGGKETLWISKGCVVRTDIGVVVVVFGRLSTLLEVTPIDSFGCVGR